jgi:5-methylcytosine-specific restriction endonuclease McrA
MACQWRKANPAKVISYCRQHQRLKRANGGDFTEQEWQLLLSEYSGMCAACGSTERIEADHIVPLSKGGINTRDNMQPLCKLCNTSKQAKTVDYRWNVGHGD